MGCIFLCRLWCLAGEGSIRTSLMKPVAAAAARAPQHVNQRMLLDTLDSPQVTVT